MAWRPLSDAPSFIVMWVVMMTAMMRPSLAPTLWRYRRGIGDAQRDRLTAWVAAGYFCVWTLIGVAVFPVAIALPAFLRATPLAAGAVVLIAGTLQFTRWKAHHLAGCRAAPQPAADAERAWRQGLRLGLHCSGSSAGLTLVLMAMGMMDLGVMVAVTAAITVERVAPAGERVARAIGIVLLGVGLVVIACR
jgi:predicted metal-binding membrane protein